MDSTAFNPPRAGENQPESAQGSANTGRRESPIAGEAFTALMVSRIERGLDCRGFYVLGQDELEFICESAASQRDREHALRNFAATVHAELQQGWTARVALLLRT